MLVLITPPSHQTDLLTSMMPLFRFLCALLSSRLLTTATLHTKSIFYLLNKAFNSAACLVSHTHKFFHTSPSLIDTSDTWLLLHFHSSSKSVPSYIKSLTLIHLSIFLTVYYLLNVQVCDPLSALSSPLSLSLISMLNCFSFFWSIFLELSFSEFQCFVLSYFSQ